MTGDRTQEILSHCTKASRILEIGPCHAPVAPRAQGWNTAIIDHLPRHELVQKYTGFTDDLDRIEEIDFIWRGGALADAVPGQFWSSFDTLIASHVIEHIPDFVDFFISAAKLLKPGGVISLAVPDKRFCFDFFRPVTSTGEVLASRGSARHSLKTAYDNTAYYTIGNPEAVWQRTSGDQLRLRSSAAQGYEVFEAHERMRELHYQDFHGSVFTPASFELLILELGQIGLIDWCILSRSGGGGSEFFVHLRRGAAPEHAWAEARRRDLLLQMQQEFQQQATCITASAPSTAAPEPANAAGALVKSWAQRFVLLVHAGNYAEATRWEPLFDNLGQTCAALGGNPSDLLHTLYCLAILALLGRQDRQAASERVAALEQQARHFAGLAETTALGKEFVGLAGQLAPPGAPSPAGLVAAVQRFVLLVHGGEYDAAAKQAPYFDDVEAVCEALAGHPSDRLHLLYCLGILTVAARHDREAAAVYFYELLRQARAIAGALGAEFETLALAELAVLPPRA